MKKLIIVVCILVFLGLVGLFIAGYFLGNIPVVSKMLGTNKAVQLGVKLSSDGAYQGLKDLKMPVTAQELDAIAKNPQSYKSVKTTLTQEEVSSLLALGNIPDFPLKLTQVKFNPDGTIESSGVLDTVELKVFLKKNGVANDVIDQIGNYVKVEAKVNYYAKGTCKIENNRVTMDISSAQIGKIPIPDSLVSRSGEMGNYISNSLVKEGYNVRKMAVAGGKLELDADRPLNSLEPWLKFVHK